MLYTLPIMLIMGLIVGFLVLFSSFGIIFALPTLIMSGTAIFAKTREKIQIASVLTLTTMLGQWLALISWIASRRPISPTASTRTWGMNLPSVAEAGFPIRSLQLPPPPMGNDLPPMDMWPSIFANQFIWLGVGLVLATIIVTLVKKMSVGALQISLVLTLVPLLYNLALFVLWFD